MEKPRIVEAITVRALDVRRRIGAAIIGKLERFDDAHDVFGEDQPGLFELDSEGRMTIGEES